MLDLFVKLVDSTTLDDSMLFKSTNPKITEILLEKGLNPNVKNEQYETPLFYYSQKGDFNKAVTDSPVK